MARLKRAVRLAAIIATGVPVIAGAQAPVPAPDSPAIERRVDSLLARMSLEAKIDLIGGDSVMYVRALPSIGLPRLRTSDGPIGVKTWGPATAYAAGIGLAAAWDTALAEQVGMALGRDARARGVNFLLGPGVNIYRAPLNGRNFEYFGEDPYLAGRTAVAYIRGVQSQGVVATIKHFAANNSEYARHHVSADMDERTLREIYLPAFEAAVRDGHVGAIMASYNFLNGVHLTQNAWMNDSIAKRDWGFDGIIMSDWDATYDGVAAANAGLDLEMPSGRFMNRSTLLPAIADGRVSRATIDDKVRRILRTAIRFGFLDREQTDATIPLYSREARDVALQTARESIVLLKNDRAFLPVDAQTIHTIAVIGPNAWPAQPTGGGSGSVQPFSAVSILTGLTDYLDGRATVLYNRGLPTSEEIYRGTAFRTDSVAGLREEVFDNPAFTGTPTSSSIVDGLSPSESLILPGLPMPRHGVRWTGTFTPPKSGRYLLLAASDDPFTVTVNDSVVIGQPLAGGQDRRWIELPMTAGQSVRVQLAVRPRSTVMRVGLGLAAVADLVNPEAVRMAAAADIAVVSVGYDRETEGEGTDRPFSLPWGQQALIEAIAAANPKTVVIVTAGGGVAMEGWLPRVPALLHTWYPGQEGGTAVAEILFGATNPEGHLPVSVERRWEDNPTHDSYYPTSGAGTSEPHVRYTEGVFLGYRYYTGSTVKPLFPFGYGLSYTTFAFSHLTVTRQHATFDVTNTGARAGATVAQLYVGDPSARVQRPAKELKGFAKVRLAPGETQHIEFPLNDRSFSYWDETTHHWRIDPGTFVIYIGDSSENTPLSADLTVAR